MKRVINNKNTILAYYSQMKEAYFIPTIILFLLLVALILCVYTIFHPIKGRTSRVAIIVDGQKEWMTSCQYFTVLGWQGKTIYGSNDDPC